MKREDFVRLVGAGKGAEYAPVAGMLVCGYGFAGYFNTRLNEEMGETCVLMNARLVPLTGEPQEAARPRIADFNEFVEEIVRRSYQAETPAEPAQRGEDVFGSTIPLAAIPFAQMAVVYPVAHIGKLMEKVEQEQRKVPSFLDLDSKSEILRFLRTKLW